MIPPSIEVRAQPGQPLGMTPAVFMRDFWQKEPLLIRGAFPEFTAPISGNELAGLACEDEVLARIVSHDRDTDRWTVENGPFAEERFLHMRSADWTLLVQDVDRWDADVRKLLESFDFLPRWRVDDIMVSFAAPGGSVGAHVDHYDVFLLQGQGQRHWAIDNRKNTPLAARKDVPLKLLQCFSVSHEWVLDPGDMLYLPPGVPHFGVAVDACLTFSIGMRAPSAAELLVAWAESRAQQLDESVRYTDPDQAPASDPGLVDSAAVGRLRRLLESTLNSTDAELSEFFARYLSTFRLAGSELSKPRRSSETTIAARLAKGAALRADAGVRLTFIDASDATALLFGHGESLACTRAAARACTGVKPISSHWWASATDDDKAGVRAALSRGWLRFEPTLSHRS